jgi:hypothetical protein
MLERDQSMDNNDNRLGTITEEQRKRKDSPTYNGRVGFSSALSPVAGDTTFFSSAGALSMAEVDDNTPEISFAHTMPRWQVSCGSAGK